MYYTKCDTGTGYEHEDRHGLQQSKFVAELKRRLAMALTEISDV